MGGGRGCHRNYILLYNYMLYMLYVMFKSTMQWEEAEDITEKYLLNLVITNPGMKNECVYVK